MEKLINGNTESLRVEMKAELAELKNAINESQSNLDTLTAGTVKRADIKEDKDGKSRGMGTVTFEQAIEAVQAISMFNGQFLFDRPMHVKMDDKSVPHEDYRSHDSKTPQLPRGLGGIGMGLGPGGQPISASQLNIGGVMGNLGPSGEYSHIISF